MAQIRYIDTDGTKGTLPAGNLGYDGYTAGGDEGRVYVGDGASNIALAKKSEVDSKIGAADVTYETLTANGDVGTGTGQVAIGDHTHSGVYEPADATILKDADIGVTVQAYDIDTAKTDVVQTFTASQRSAVTTNNALSFSLAATNNFKCTPTATGQLTFTDLADGQGGRIILDNSGGYIITKNALVLASSTFLNTVSTAGVYLIGYECDGVNIFINSTEALV